MEKINMEKKLLVSASPHIRDHISTRRIMLDVVIALALIISFGIFAMFLREFITDPKITDFFNPEYFSSF
jgi:Na+-transporting NADH:ubiquinone oxidoreductase subunit NqrB